MGDDSTFYKGVFLMVFAFGTGFGVGYKVMRSVQYISFPICECYGVVFVSCNQYTSMLVIRQKSGGWSGLRGGERDWQ